MYIDLREDGSLRRVESKLEESGECMIKEEVISYVLNSNETELVYTDNRGESGKRFIRKEGSEKFFVHNSKLEGRWVLKFEEEDFVGSVVSASESFVKISDLELPDCPNDFMPESMTTGLVFWIDRSVEFQAISYGVGFENGCVSATFHGRYEENLEENKLEMRISTDWDDDIEIELEYEFKNDNQWFFSQNS